MLISKFKTDIDQIDIKRIEKTLGIELPKEYSSFIDRYNGGETPNTEWHGKNRSDVRGFFGVDVSDRNWDLLEQVKSETGTTLFENGLLPIACNVFGDYFCLNYKVGTIWLMYHDADRKELLADDFSSFISKCKSERIRKEAMLSIEEREQMMIAKGKADKITDGLRKMWQAEIDKYFGMNQEEVVFDASENKKS